MSDGVMIKNCEFCGVEFTPNLRYGGGKRQRFCSKKCSWTQWNRTKGKGANYKKELLCRFCKKPISVESRKQGRKLYHTQCVEPNRKRQARERAKKAGSEFRKMKKKVGCQFCGYDRYGGSLDFHHFEETKGRRIDVMTWWYGHKLMWDELEKCILLCKNCHHELHGEIE